MVTYYSSQYNDYIHLTVSLPKGLPQLVLDWLSNLHLVFLMPI